MANKLFSKAKELGIEAKGIQRQKFISEYGTSDGPPAVSPQALQLLREEAVRCYITNSFSLARNALKPMTAAQGCRADAQGCGSSEECQGRAPAKRQLIMILFGRVSRRVYHTACRLVRVAWFGAERL